MFIVNLFGFIGLIIGIASTWVLIKIGGHSDGPGAVIFYIAAFFGFLIAWAVFIPVKKKED